MFIKKFLCAMALGAATSLGSLLVKVSYKEVSKPTTKAKLKNVITNITTKLKKGKGRKRSFSFCSRKLHTPL